MRLVRWYLAASRVTRCAGIADRTSGNSEYLRLMLVPWGYSYQHYTDFVETAGSALFLAPLRYSYMAIGIALLKSRALTLQPSGHRDAGARACGAATIRARVSAPGEIPLRASIGVVWQSQSHRMAGGA